MWSFVLSAIGWLISLFKRPSEAEKLGRTEDELANAKRALQEIQNVQKIETTNANTPIDILKLRYARFKDNK